jgi:hypothetical protein
LRLFAASEALAAKRGGIAAVSAVTGIARSTIGRGLKELSAPEKAPPQNRVRRTGGGRKAAVVKQPGLVKALTELIQSALRGDPEADLLWVSKSQRHLAKALCRHGYSVTYKIVGRLLSEMGFSRQANAKMREGGKQPSRTSTSGMTTSMATGTTPSSLPHIRELKNHPHNEALILSQALRVTAFCLARPDKIEPKHYRCSHEADGNSHRLHGSSLNHVGRASSSLPAIR